MGVKQQPSLKTKEKGDQEIIRVDSFDRRLQRGAERPRGNAFSSS